MAKQKFNDEIDYDPDLDMIDAVPTLAALGEKVRGRTDPDILIGVTTVGGTDALLAHVFGHLLPAAFTPARLAGRALVLQFDLATPAGPRTRQLRVADDAREVRAAAELAPSAVYALALPDFLRLVAGDPALALADAQLGGDVVLAREVAGWFRPDA